MDKYDKLLKTVLKEITPRTKELKGVQAFVDSLNNKLKKKNIQAKAVIGGSYAKKTFLKGDHDVDIFVKFSLKYKNDDLSELLAPLVRTANRIHGSRDYFQMTRGKISYEIVPVLHIRKLSDAQNVTDFSPLHVDWVKKNNKKLHDDIRLAKKFCKSNKSYGAESYLRGFSGHVLDTLIIYYGGFIPFLQEARHWKKREVIDFYNTYKGKALLRMNVSKIQCPLVVVDPVSPERNAASALGWEKYELFKDLAEEFLHHPSEVFFKEKKFNLRALKKRHGVLIVLTVRSLQGKEDVVGSKLLKVFETIRGNLENYYVHAADWEWDRSKKAIFWYNIDKKKLPKMHEVRGPPVGKKQNSSTFKAKHKDNFIKNGRLYAHEKRKIRDALKQVEQVMGESRIKEKIKQWQVTYYG